MNGRPERRAQRKVVVLNPKGGCGKTTLATTLASWYALKGYRVALMDLDPQGSSLHWLRKRPGERAPIRGIDAHASTAGVTRSFQLRLPPDVERLVVDTPAGLDGPRIAEITRHAHAVIVPVLPSDIDIHAASRYIGELLLHGRFDDRGQRVAVVANRVRTTNRMYQPLLRFLNSLSIPFVATLQDSQNYVAASEAGLGIHEMPAYLVSQDTLCWRGLLDWLETRPDHWADGALTPAAVS
ncbi:MAG TPA: ParA family protein [Gammaproteobacteria bacterium]|nr:ParA family protein [Gammaproteobacteria bacterium]